MKVVIIDYGLGNIFSIQRAILNLNQQVAITDNHQEILNADRVILPGVGAFGDAMAKLKAKELNKVLIEYSYSGKPILGICLGAQLLMSESEEFGLHKGLGLIEGQVMKLPEWGLEGKKYKVPHVGWNQTFSRNNAKSLNSWEKTILSQNLGGDFFYFAHSYYILPKDQSCILANTEYAEILFCSVVNKGNIYGCQFHPELSGEGGQKIYRQFLYSESLVNINK
ncbi:MAG: imidazole glycerol phosphate synthase subunit HisH [Candidatus Omnitrophica bacterium]|jgi:glutamine amidotransferase|nr:imidazole glycerol phosphate synthase subunit HisH [Candidatus Omnitrophota bacterium]